MQYWSWVLTAVGVFGLWLAGRRNKLGWAVGLGAQGLWIAYALTTRQYGFLVSAGAYGWVYATNLRRWRQETSASGAPESESSTPVSLESSDLDGEMESWRTPEK